MQLDHDEEGAKFVHSKKNKKTSKISKSDQPIDKCYLAFTYGCIAIISTYSSILNELNIGGARTR